MVGGLHYYQTAVDLLRDYYPTTTSVAILETYCMVKGKEKVLQNTHPPPQLSSSQARPIPISPYQNSLHRTSCTYYHYYPGTQPSTLLSKSLYEDHPIVHITTSTAHRNPLINPTKSFCKISRLNSFSRPPQRNKTYNKRPIQIKIQSMGSSIIISISFSHSLSPCKEL